MEEKKTRDVTESLELFDRLTEDQKQDGEEIAGFQKSGHGSAGHGDAEKSHEGTENDQ